MSDVPSTEPVDPVDRVPAPPPTPAAVPRRGRWIGLVWALPLAALLIVGFLGIRALMDRGVDVVVTFDTGAGARVDDTKVIYQGVEAGHVTKIAINEDGHRVDMTLRLDPKAEPGLTTTTTFWLIGANPSLNDITSVKAALAGLMIGVAPSTGGAPARHFIGLSGPPIILPGTPGTSYSLTTDKLASLSPGSPLFYRGQQIGKLTSVHFNGPEGFRLDAFVQAPYDALIRPSGAFWISNPVQVSLTETGASASLEHPSALLNGAIEFDFVNGIKTDKQSPAGSAFPLYPDRKDARTGPPGPEVPYAFRFSGPAGELAEGAAVRLLGFQVGAVKSVRLQIDPATGLASTAVRAVLYPQKLHLALPPGQADAIGWQRVTDAMVGRLLAHGYRARLLQTPPVIGGRVISLDAVSDARPAKLGSGEPKLIPSDDASGGLDETIGQVNQLLAKFNRLPIDAIGHDVQRITGRLDAMISSPQLTESLAHLNSTLAQADSMMHDVAPKVGPLVAKLNSAADEVSGTAAAAHQLVGGSGGAADGSLPAAIQELSDAARSIRALADYLGRHPESLLRGRGSASSDSSSKDGR